MSEPKRRILHESDNLALYIVTEWGVAHDRGIYLLGSPDQELVKILRSMVHERLFDPRKDISGGCFTLTWRSGWWGFWWFPAYK